MSPTMFLVAFNPFILLQLSADLNYSHSFVIQPPLKNLEDLPPIDSTIYVKWLEQGNESPSWYRAIVFEYFQDGTCRLVYMMTLPMLLFLR